MTFFSQVRGHENLQIFRLSGKPLKMLKTTTSWPQDPWNVHLCWFGWEICKNVKCPKTTFFSQVSSHETLQIFWLSGKPLKIMKTTTSWPQDPWNTHICWFGWEKCEMPKITFFSQVWKAFQKMMKITTCSPQDPWNVHICWFGWEICKNVKCPKMTFFSQVRGHKNLQIFRLSGKPFKMMKITTSWPQDPWNVHICWFGWEICKNVKCPKTTFFSEVSSHENLQIFRLSGKPLKMMKTTTSWPQDPWNVHFC